MSSNINTHQLCPHVQVAEDGRRPWRGDLLDARAEAICHLPDETINHLLSCLPPHPPDRPGYVPITLRTGLEKLSQERANARRRQQRSQERTRRI